MELLKPGNGLFKIINLAIEDIVGIEDCSYVTMIIEKDDNKIKPIRAKIFLTEYPFRSGITKENIRINKDQEILKLFSQIFNATGNLEWFYDQDGKFESLSDFISEINKVKPFGDLSYRFCVAGKFFINKNNEEEMYLFLPKFSIEGTPIERDDISMTNLLLFTPEEYLIKYHKNDFQFSQNISS
jgi:hypothetical protein